MKKSCKRTSGTSENNEVRTLRKKPRVNYMEDVTEDESESETETEIETESDTDDENLFQPIQLTYSDWEVEQLDGIRMQMERGRLIPQFHCVWANWTGEGRTSWINADAINVTNLNEQTMMNIKQNCLMTLTLISIESRQNGLDEQFMRILRDILPPSVFTPSVPCVNPFQLRVVCSLVD